MTTRADLSSVALGQRVEGHFLIADVDERTPDAGDPYTVLSLSNASGSIRTQPFWAGRRDEIAGLRRGHAVSVVGEVTSYRERRQLKVISIRHLPEGAYDAASLLPSVGGVARYWDTLDGWRAELAKPRLRHVVDLFYEDEDFRRRYEQCPAATRGHHAALGGLLKHTVEVAAIGRTTARACGADPELVLAGALLHDIGKLEAYRWDRPFEYTEPGRLLGHVVLGALMLDRRLRQAASACTPVERDILLHFVLSHHGRLEYGSPVEPLTLEAEVLHWADHASAQTDALAQALAADGNFPEGAFSVPQRLLGGRRISRLASDWGAGGGPPP